MKHRKCISIVEDNEINCVMLQANDCDFAQGYYYAKPLPESEFTKLL